MLLCAFGTDRRRVLPQKLLLLPRGQAHRLRTLGARIFLRRHSTIERFDHLPKCRHVRHLERQH
jgi:hypothetical protein